MHIQDYREIVFKMPTLLKDCQCRLELDETRLLLTIDQILTYHLLINLLYIMNNFNILVQFQEQIKALICRILLFKIILQTEKRKHELT